ncbi:hypothetical protein [Candidatus Methylomirabilis sp.]|uniref:hypothetical protein n=1 Tax=Candidatus Methylomirabilis sp. TaxID=2032687 RepID=UPI002A6333EB|nr:hypothetical protein [Candidatus Methylomirabilis sp.]
MTSGGKPQLAETGIKPKANVHMAHWGIMRHEGPFCFEGISVEWQEREEPGGCAVNQRGIMRKPYKTSRQSTRLRSYRDCGPYAMKSFTLPRPGLRRSQLIQVFGPACAGIVAE